IAPGGTRTVDVAGERRGVARDIDNVTRPQIRHRLDRRFGAPGTRRIEHEDIDVSLEPGGGILDTAAPVSDIAASVELHVELPQAHGVGALFDRDDVGRMIRQPRGEHADSGIGVDHPLAATELRKGDGTLVEDVALPRIDLDEGLGTDAEVATRVLDPDRVVVEVELGDPARGSRAKSWIGRARR